MYLPVEKEEPEVVVGLFAFREDMSEPWVEPVRSMEKLRAARRRTARAPMESVELMSSRKDTSSSDTSCSIDRT
jgi:hypothetical protein